MAKLWGDNFFNPTTRKWTTNATADDGKPLERGFNMFVLDPIVKIFDAVASSEYDIVKLMLRKLGVVLSQDDRDLTGEQLFSAIMRKFLPAGDTLLELIVINLPLPLLRSLIALRTSMMDQWMTSLASASETVIQMVRSSFTFSR